MKAIFLARVSDKKQDSNEAQMTRVLEYAQVIDTLKELETPERNGKNRLIAVAITEAQGSQMWAVKATTWRE